jgi:hypothetical protein
MKSKIHEYLNKINKNMSKKVMIMICLALVSWSAYAQQNHDRESEKQQMSPMFKDKNLGAAYGHYTLLKNALVASKADEAKKAAEELQKALATVENGKTAQTEATKVASASSLESQRKTFAALTHEMTALVKHGEISEGTIHLDYCPMANSNAGGYWLSNEKEIKNPYFGDKMMKCGSVKEILN